MLFATSEFGQKATVSFINGQFNVIGEEPLADEIRLALQEVDVLARHDGTPLESLSGVLELMDIHCILDEEDRTTEDVPEGAVF